MGRTSRIPGFHKLSVEERLKIVREFAELSEDEMAVLGKRGHLSVNNTLRIAPGIGIGPLHDIPPDRPLAPHYHEMRPKSQQWTLKKLPPLSSNPLDQ